MPFYKPKIADLEKAILDLKEQASFSVRVENLITQLTTIYFLETFILNETRQEEIEKLKKTKEKLIDALRKEAILLRDGSDNALSQIAYRVLITLAYFSPLNAPDVEEEEQIHINVNGEIVVDQVQVPVYVDNLSLQPIEENSDEDQKFIALSNGHLYDAFGALVASKSKTDPCTGVNGLPWDADDLVTLKVFCEKTKDQRQTENNQTVQHTQQQTMPPQPIVNILCLQGFKTILRDYWQYETVEYCKRRAAQQLEHSLQNIRNANDVTRLSSELGDMLKDRRNKNTIFEAAPWNHSKLEQHFVTAKTLIDHHQIHHRASAFPGLNSNRLTNLQKNLADYINRKMTDNEVKESNAILLRDLLNECNPENLSRSIELLDDILNHPYSENTLFKANIFKKVFKKGSELKRLYKQAKEILLDLQNQHQHQIIPQTDTPRVAP